MSNETAFTPGPWYVSQGNPRDIMAKVDGFDAYEPVTKVGKYILFANDANAALIAAAPELYAALESCTREFITFSKTPAYKRLEAALKKARGE